MRVVEGEGMVKEKRMVEEVMGGYKASGNYL